MRIELIETEIMAIIREKAERINGAIAAAPFACDKAILLQELAILRDYVHSQESLDYATKDTLSEMLNVLQRKLITLSRV